MSKTIKAIKCPQCRSTRSTLLGEDKYRCNHCGAEFILDNDDINIIINKQPEGHYVGNHAIKPIAIIAAGLLAVVFFILILAASRSEKGNNKPVSTVTFNEPHSEVISGTMSILSGKEISAPLCIFVEKQTDRQSKIQSYRMVVYDIIGQKQIKKTELDINTKVSIKVFSDTFVYLISDMRVLYKIDTRGFELINITNTLQTDYNQLSSGLSSIDFSPEANALTVITNVGHTYTVFPDIQKAYTTAELAGIKKQRANQQIPETTGYDYESVLYNDESGLLKSYKSPSAADFITEYIDSETKKSKWKINSAIKTEMARPYKDGFILMNNTLRQLTIVQKNGEYKQIQL